MVRHSMIDSYIWEKEFKLMLDQEHFEKVWDIVESSLDDFITLYFDSSKNPISVLKPKDNLNLYIRKLIDEHCTEQDRYIEIFDPELMDDYEEDVDGFKGEILSKRCPVIRVTLNSKAAVLKDWKIAYKLASPQKLYDTFYNIISFAEEYNDDMTEEEFNEIDTIEGNRLSELTEDACYLTGVIGTGILSNVLNNLYPRIFPNMFKIGMFALYILSEKKAIEMGSDSSEFLMVKDDIPSKTGIIEAEHNYYYPYETFALYTLRIYRVLDKEIQVRYKLKFPDEYRFVLINDFYKYIVESQRKDIQTLLGNDDIYKFRIPI